MVRGMESSSTLRQGQGSYRAAGQDQVAFLRASSAASGGRACRNRFNQLTNGLGVSRPSLFLEQFGVRTQANKDQGRVRLVLLAIDQHQIRFHMQIPVVVP